jgi:AhpD family alkylhydroperoxidase
MERFKHLDAKTIEFAGIAASIAGGCRPCFDYHFKKALEVGCNIEQVKIVFHDVLTEAGAPYAKKYEIEAIPTQVFLDETGNEFFRHTGFFPEEELIKVLNQKMVR